MTDNRSTPERRAMREHLRLGVGHLQAQATSLSDGARALQAMAAQAMRRSQAARLDAQVTTVTGALERFQATLDTWDGQEPSAKDMTKWMDDIELRLADVEKRLSQLKRSG